MTLFKHKHITLMFNRLPIFFVCGAKGSVMVNNDESRINKLTLNFCTKFMKVCHD